jgi:hypothetical protein
MPHMSGFERSSGFERAPIFVPEAVDDDVGADNPVRFIGTFADELGLAAAGFVRAAATATCRPGYAPADLLKLSISGYFNPSRRREMESHRHRSLLQDRGHRGCEMAGLMPPVPKPQRGSSVRNGLFVPQGRVPP